MPASFRRRDAGNEAEPSGRRQTEVQGLSAGRGRGAWEQTRSLKGLGRASPGETGARPDAGRTVGPSGAGVLESTVIGASMPGATVTVY